MLKRQKTLLAILLGCDRPPTATLLVKLAFLLSEETQVRAKLPFYEFVPYKYGPFSFSLYRELSALERNGYVARRGDRICLSEETIHQSAQKKSELDPDVRHAVDEVIAKYSNLSQKDLLKSVYSRYPWFASKSDLDDLKPPLGVRCSAARHAVYTTGYERKTPDGFFNALLKAGIEVLIDVRSNPVSRKYGFAKKSLRDIAEKLGFSYLHKPRFGIPSEMRVGLHDFDSYQHLMARYETEILPSLSDDVERLASMMESRPSILMCMEKDVRCCHRSRLANAVSRVNQLPVVHL